MKLKTLTLGSRRRLGFLPLSAIFFCAASNFTGAQSAWNWNGGTSGNWSGGGGANWTLNSVGGSSLPQGYLNFPSGASFLNNTNDYAAYSGAFQIYFNSGASSYNLYGNPLKFYDWIGTAAVIQNDSANLQTINFLFGAGNSVGININPNAGDLTINGTNSLFLDGPSQIRVNGNAGRTVTFNVGIGDGSPAGGTFALLGAGTARFTATNTYTGDTFINNGTLVLATNSALMNGGNFVRLGDTSGSAGAHLNLNGGNNLSTSINVRGGSSGTKIIANTSGTIGNAAFGGSLFLDADATLFANSTGGNTLSSATLDLKNQTLTVSGTGSNVISGVLQQSTGSGKLVKNNTGGLTLSGNNTFTGGTTLNAGTVNINSATAIGSGTFTVSGNGTFDNTSGGVITNVNNNALTLSGGSPTFTGTTNLNFGSGVVTISGANRTVTVSANTLTLGGGVTDAGGAIKLTKAGAGTLVLNGAAGTWIGGSSLDAGTLSVGNDTALGSGNLALNGSTSILIAGNGARTLANSFTMAVSATIGGSNNLTLAGRFTNSAASHTLTIANTGTTTLAGNVFLADDNVTARTVTITNVGPVIISGAISNNAAGNTIASSLTYLGTNTLTLSGANNYSGLTMISAGTLTLPGTGVLNSGGGTGVGSLLVGNVAGNALMKISGGTVNVGSTATLVGSAAGGNGFINMSSGTFSSISAGQQDIDVGRTGNGVFTLSGGSVTLNGYVVGGITTSGAIGIWNISGGSVNVVGNYAGTLGATAGTIGLMNVTGTGTFLATNNTSAGAAGLFVGEAGTGYLNVSGAGILYLGGTNNGVQGLDIGKNNAAAVGIVNLGGVGTGGGTINTIRVQKAGALASGTLNFHGGTLQASAPTATAQAITYTNFMSGLTAAYVYGEGATIDDNGTNITVGQALISPAGNNGVNGIASFTGGAGYIDTPLVSVVRGSGDVTGVNATAIAQVDTSTGNATSGQVTNVLITNPGLNYTVPPTFTLSGGGAATAATITGTTPTANVSGSLTKIGSGTLTLSGANTYTNGTIIKVGTLKAGAANVIPGSATAGSLSISNGATLDLNTFSQTVNGLLGGGTIDNNAAGTPTLTLGANNASSTFSGLIKNTAGTLTLTVTNSSALLTLAGANNTFSGGVNIGNGAANFRSGVVRAAATQTLGTGTVTVGNGGNESTGRLELSNSITLNNFFNLPQRSGNSVSIENVSGNNILSGTLGLTAGGSFALVQSDAGTLTLGTAASTAISNQITGSTRLITLTGAGNGTVAGNIVDVGTAVIGLIKDGAGTWTLTGTNTFTGTTAVNAGELIGLTGGSLSNSVVTVNTGATNGVLLTTANGQWVCGGLTYSSGTTYADFNFNGNVPSTTTAPLLINGNLAFTVAPTVIVRSGAVLIPTGTYPLFKYSGTLTGTLPTTLILPGGMVATLVNNTGNKSIDLNVTLVNQLTWVGGVNTNWDIGITANWKNNNGIITNYADGAAVIFDDTTVTNSINIIGTVSPASMTFSNSTQNYTFTNGIIAGGGSLIKNGVGSLSLTNANTYTGVTILNGGTLALGGASPLGIGGNFTNNNGTTVQFYAPTIANNIVVPTGATVSWVKNAPGGPTLSGSLSGGGTINESGNINPSLNFSGDNSGFTGVMNSANSGSNHRWRFNSATAGSAAAAWSLNAVATDAYGFNFATGTIFFGSLSGSGTFRNDLAGMVTLSVGALNTDAIFSGTIVGNDTSILALTKTGTGTFTVSGNSPHSGATTVNKGALMGVAGGSFSNSPVTINTGATNGVIVNTAGLQWVCTNLTYAAGTEYLNLTFNTNTPSTTVAALLVQNNLTISGTLNIIISGSGLLTNTYPLIKYTNTLTGAPVLTPLALPYRTLGYITNDTANKLISLVVTNFGGAANLVWQPGNGLWDNTTGNWKNQSAVITSYVDPIDIVLFDETPAGSGPFTVTSSSSFSPVSMTVSNVTKQYKMAGSGIIGATPLTKNGSGTLVLVNTNTATGLVTSTPA